MGLQRIQAEAGRSVSGLLPALRDAAACLVPAHGAGTAHPFMASVAQGLAERGVATLRYRFP
jgi:predicted alpha/beta-hydrolase family hydrolase